MMYNNLYKDKVVLITGHTGFKGSWLTIWLLKLGAKIVGISKDIPTNPSMFDALNLEKKIIDYRFDINDLEKLKATIQKEKPDFIFHLAAQSLVSVSYSNPLETFFSNSMGTANLLESIRFYQNKITLILITSDKAYDNVEQIWGYKENDKMGGKDIYSGSKGAAELVIKSYYNSFFKFDHSNIRLAVARAGNVIGGGDWAKDRIVADAILAWNKEEKVEIRSPNATRPWQHVLEPLSGYLNLGMKLHESKILNGECFNFGPITGEDKTVKKLLTDLSKYWDFSKNNEAISINENKNFHEATLLKLNCEKSLALLNWHSSLDYKDTIKFICEWYSGYYKKNADMNEITNNQILNYQSIAKLKFLKWTA